MEKSSTGIMPRVLAITAIAGRIAANGYGKQSEWTDELMDAARSGSLPIHEYLNGDVVPWIISTVKTVDVQRYLVDQHGLDLLTVKAGATAEEMPNTTTDKPDPMPVTEAGAVVTAGASDDAEQGLTTSEIAYAFYDVFGWPAERWIKNLSAAKWAAPALIGLGEQGGAPSVWRPLILAQLIHARVKGDKEKQTTLQLLHARFKRQTALAPWRDDFNEFFATFSDAD